MQMFLEKKNTKNFSLTKGMRLLMNYYVIYTIAVKQHSIAFVSIAQNILVWHSEQSPLCLPVSSLSQLYLALLFVLSYQKYLLIWIMTKFLQLIMWIVCVSYKLQCIGKSISIESGDKNDYNMMFLIFPDSPWQSCNNNSYALCVRHEIWQLRYIKHHISTSGRKEVWEWLAGVAANQESESVRVTKQDWMSLILS